MQFFSFLDFLILFHNTVEPMLPLDTSLSLIIEIKVSLLYHMLFRNYPHHIKSLPAYIFLDAHHQCIYNLDQLYWFHHLMRGE